MQPEVIFKAKSLPVNAVALYNDHDLLYETNIEFFEINIYEVNSFEPQIKHLNIILGNGTQTKNSKKYCIDEVVVING